LFVCFLLLCVWCFFHLLLQLIKRRNMSVKSLQGRRLGWKDSNFTGVDGWLFSGNKKAIRRKRNILKVSTLSVINFWDWYSKPVRRMYWSDQACSQPVFMGLPSPPFPPLPCLPFPSLPFLSPSLLSFPVPSCVLLSPLIPPFPSLPLRGRPLLWLGVWRCAQASPAGPGGARPPNGFWRIVG